MIPRMGRPKSDNPKANRITIRLDKEMLDKLDMIANKDLETKAEIIRRSVKKMYDEKKFIEKMLAKKELLEDEHKKVLDIIFKNARFEQRTVDENFNFIPNRTQSMSYIDILEKVKDMLSDEVLNICLHDLESMGFIMNTMLNPYKAKEYAILKLGLEYIKKHNV